MEGTILVMQEVDRKGYELIKERPEGVYLLKIKKNIYTTTLPGISGVT